MTRLLVPFVLLALALLANPTLARAESGACNEFESVQSILLAEGAYQPLAAQIEMARVAVGHGACNLDANFYAAFGLATFVNENEPSHCIQVFACRAFFLLYTIAPDVREPAAIASHIALTESPRIVRRHFDSKYSQAYWWNSREACPDSWFVVGDIKVC